MDYPDQVTILSYGGGTNSTALLLEWVKRGYRLDAVIFADTGSEQPKTYDFINNYIVPYCEENNLPFHTVKYTVGERARGVKEGEWEADQEVAIYDWYKYMKILPSIKDRGCTDKWKIQPIKKLIKNKYPDSIQLIGIDAGETRRAQRTRDPKTGEWVYLYPDKRYPLIDWNIDRKGCSKIIEEHGWPSPEKSGCYFCPFQPAKNWTELYNTSPDLFNKSLKLEVENRNFPNMTLMTTGPKRLDWFKKGLDTQTSLFDFGDDDNHIPCACYDG
tara:strand:- start:1925 stop:2743 length:819 start_codon:yes stop_codon:yes gene_type:complete